MFLYDYKQWERRFSNSGQKYYLQAIFRRSSRNLILSLDFLRLPLQETKFPLFDSQAEPERAGSYVPEEALPRQLRVPDSTQSL